MAKTSSKTAQEACPRCHKLVTSHRPGSFTGWIFKGSTCQCSSTTRARAQLESLAIFRQSGIYEVSAPVETPDLPSQYEVISFIGQGGMGSVFKVRDKRQDKVLAIKVLRRELAASETAVKRFEAEATAVAQLSHDNLVTIYGVEHTFDGKPFLIMDYIAGESLSSLIQREGRLSLNRSLNIFIQICDAVSHAHMRGIIHRDLKPSNVILSQEEDGFEMVHVVDFGIAKVQHTDIIQTIDMTGTGDVLGSPTYMSPEQCLSVGLDGRSDIYSMGCLMYEVITSKPPFEGFNPVQIIAKHLNEPPRSIASHPFLNLPDDLEAVIFTCLEKNPIDRYQSLFDLKADLETIESGKRLTTRARQRRLIKKSYALLETTGLIAVAASWALLILSIWHYQNEIRTVTRAQSIITEATTVSKLHYDAGVAIGGYSMTRSPVFRERFDGLTKTIPEHLKELERLLQDFPEQSARLEEIRTLARSSLSVLRQSREVVDNNDTEVEQTQTRNLYKNIRSISDELQEKLRLLIADCKDKLSRTSDADSLGRDLLLAAGLCLMLNATAMIYLDKRRPRY